MTQIIHLETIDYSPAQPGPSHAFVEKLNGILKEHEGAWVKWLTCISGQRIFVTAIIMKKDRTNVD